MQWAVKSYVEPPNKIKRRFTTGSTANGNFVTYEGWADPKTLTSSAKWLIIQTVYDSNGEDITTLFMNGSNHYDQILDNYSAAGTTWA